MEQQETKSTLSELAQIKADAMGAARSGGNNSNPDEEETEVPALPEGSAPLEAKAPPEEEEAPVKTKEPKEKIIIGDKEFESEDEAIKYAQTIEQEKSKIEAYNQGIYETLQAIQKPQAAAAPVQEEFSDEEFYANPREALKKVKEEAKREALGVIQAEQRREQLWRDFFELNPDLVGHKSICEHVLNQNWNTIGMIKDEKEAMKTLGRKTRAIFQDYAEKAKPRSELPATKTHAVAAGGAAPNRVTQTKSAEKPLDFISQVRKMKGLA